MIYAEISNNVVVQLIEVKDGKSIQDYFHSSLLDNFISLGDNTDNVYKGCIYDPVEGIFTRPE